MREGFHQRRRAWQPTRRQAQVLELLVQGLTNEEIGSQLGISADGVKWHVGELLGQTGLSSRYELAEWWRNPGSRRAIVPPAWPAALRLGIAAAGVIVAVATVALLTLVIMPGGNAGEDDGSGFVPGVDVGAEGATGNSQPAARRAPVSGPKPFFAVRQLDYAGTPTIRISGGDLPRPVTIPAVEFAIACAHSTSNGLACTAGVERQGLPEPDAALPRYRLDFVYIGADYDVPNEWFWYGSEEAPEHEYWYVPSEPAVAGPLPEYGWVELGSPVAGLIERYVRLAGAGLVGEEPTLYEGLAASFEYFNGWAKLAGPGPGGVERTLPDEAARRLVGLVGEMQPAIVVLEGGLIGQRPVESVRVELAFGEETFSFLYLPPGGIAERGMVVANEEAMSSYRLAGTRYAKRAFVATPAFEAFMADLGFTGGPLDGVSSSVVQPEPERWRFISRIEMWREGDDERLVLPPLGEQPCPDGCELEYPASGPTGEPLKVAIWPTGVQPFTDLVSPALFDYYPDDGSGRGVLVQTACPAVAGGHCSQFVDFSFYPPPGIAAALEEGARQLR